MRENDFLTDYYPLSGDLNDLLKKDRQSINKEEFVSVLPVCFDEGSTDGIANQIEDPEIIIGLAYANKLDPFQALTLIVKKAFEGYVLLEWNYTPDQIGNSGTTLLDIDREVTVSFTAGFGNSLDSYSSGIKLNWKNICRIYQLDFDSAFFQTVLNYILGNKLFKLPVLLLSEYSIVNFKKVSEATSSAIGCMFRQMLITDHYLSHYRMVQLVNKRYHKRFEQWLRVIESKLEVLRQLEIRLTLARNPEVSNETELDQQYYNFIVDSRSNDRPVAIENYSVNDKINGSGNLKSEKELWTKIKLIFRLISKNCREIHLADRNELQHNDLNELFISSVEIYNDSTDNQTDILLNYSKLTDLLSKVLLYRKLNGLEMFFGILPIDKGFENQGDNPEEARFRLQKKLDERLLTIQALNYTSFKSRNICDEELATMHESFLARQIVYLDQSIVSKSAEISSCLQSKKVSEIV
jgi:hypothetical protein